MKDNKGYIMLESIIALSIILMILGLIYQLLFYSINISESIEANIEIEEMALGAMEQIEEVIQGSKGIINRQQCGSLSQLKDIKSIKCEYRTEGTFDERNKEIVFKPEYEKMFINNLDWSNSSMAGGYEIGAYITNLYIGLNDDGNLVKVRIELNKDNENYHMERMISILNFEG